jgi:RNA polymerase sigma-70 factor (ECF subfamily)
MGAQGNTRLEKLLDLLREGDESVRWELIEQACTRLQQLSHKMLRRYPHVRRWEQTDDVLQNALVRLHRSLLKVRPDSARHFFGLAALHIRRELIDLARHYFGPEGLGAHHATHNERPLQEDTAQGLDFVGEPVAVEEWAEFHEQIDSLPAEEREIVHLLYYQGVTQKETAAVLGISERTVKRRWQTAKILLYNALKQESP